MFRILLGMLNLFGAISVEEMSGKDTLVVLVFPPPSGPWKVAPGRAGCVDLR